VISLATIIDGKALLETVLAAAVAGVGITLAASTAIYGFATFAEARTDGRFIAAGGAALLALVASLAFVGGIAVGLIVMVSG